MDRIVTIILLSLALVTAAPAQADEVGQVRQNQIDLQERLDALQSKRSDVPGFAIAVIDRKGVFSAASGVSDPDGTKMTPTTPFRLASVTKTFVAAALLKCAEQGKLDLDAPISGLLSPGHTKLLASDGYDPDAITVRQLMMHSAGLADHFSSAEGREAAFADPFRLWTRTEQLALMIELTDPLGMPGEKFEYSDTGYILLGEILETITGQTLADAVRELNDFDALGITAFRWETLKGEEPSPTRAHQYIAGFDIFAMNGSLDAYGGGGLIGNVVDTAKYYDALFAGDIFASPDTLNLMMNAPGHPDGSPYRLGLFTMTLDDTPIYQHAGFWGVRAMHVPALDLTIAFVSLAEEGEDDVRALAMRLIQERLDP